MSWIDFFVMLKTIEIIAGTVLAVGLIGVVLWCVWKQIE